MSVTILEIAERANVAPSTVSRALSGKGRVAERTRKRILEIAQSMGYDASPAPARAIGILYHNRLRFLIGDAFYGTILESVEASFRAWGYRVFFSTLGDGREDLGRFHQRGEHDGFIIVGCDASHQVIRGLHDAGFPVVLVDNEVPALGVDAVVTANEDGSRELTEHLIARGHRCIAYVAGPLTHISLQQRLNGYRQALQQAGLPADAAWVADAGAGNFGYDTGRAGFETLWVRRRLRPTAILCSNDVVASGVLSAAHELGLRVPGDLAVAGFDDVAQGTRPTLTTMHIFRRHMGAEAARLLYERIQKPDRPATKVALYPTLQVRESTGGPVDKVGGVADAVVGD